MPSSAASEYPLPGRAPATFATVRMPSASASADQHVGHPDRWSPSAAPPVHAGTSPAMARSATANPLLSARPRWYRRTATRPPARRCPPPTGSPPPPARAGPNRPHRRGRHRLRRGGAAGGADLVPDELDPLGRPGDLVAGHHRGPGLAEPVGQRLVPGCPVAARPAADALDRIAGVLGDAPPPFLRRLLRLPDHHHPRFGEQARRHQIGEFHRGQATARRLPPLHLRVHLPGRCRTAPAIARSTSSCSSPRTSSSGLGRRRHGRWGAPVHPVSTADTPEVHRQPG